MYCVSKEVGPNCWVRELYFNTELKAWIFARTKSKASMCTYRVVDEATGEVTSIVRHGFGLIE